LNLTRLWAVFKARNREFTRDRAALTWNFLFPILIIAGFAFAFSGEPTAQYKVGVINKAVVSDNSFLSTKYIQFINITDHAAAITKVDRHQIDMLLDPQGKRYWINTTSPKGYILERVLAGSNKKTEVAYTKATVSGREIRYVDWLLPGVLAMNMMFSALFGIGYVIVRYRKNGVLKRLKATPVTALEFLTAQIFSRVWLIMFVLILVYAGTDAFVGFTMHGSYFNLLLVFLLGGVCLISMAMLIASRIKSEELAGGLLNMASWPMMFLSGVWFSNEGLHPWLQYFAQALPLTHVIDAARSIMIDGTGLAGISTHLTVLVLMSSIFMLIGAWLFRWD